MNFVKSTTITAPGRVFLFGEHSDYLGLEVISAALNLKIKVRVKPRDDDNIKISYLNLNQKDEFHLTENIQYKHDRDYVRSAFNILKKNDIHPKIGADLEISGDIPIAAGLSSSSALSVASVMTFLHLADDSLSKQELAKLAFEAEVVEFGESGGMMDHLASIFGNIIHVDFGEKLELTELPAKLSGLIIGDSLEKKQDTVGDLRFIRNNVEAGYQQLSKYIENFSHRRSSLEEVLQYINKLDEPSRSMTLTSIQNRDLTRKALSLLHKKNPDENTIGELLNQHHLLLRDGLKRSTPKIEKMINASLKAGAIGAKMNGSGGGGTMLAYAPGKEQRISKAILKAGWVPYIIKISNGATLEFK